MSAGFNFENISLSSPADITKVMNNFNKIEQNGITNAKATRLATTSQAGWMSSTDKSKLNGIASGATKVTKTSDITNDSGYLTAHQDISGKEDKSNKVTSISSSSTNTQYPSAKLLYNQLALKEDTSNKVAELSSSSTNTQYPGAKLVYDQLELKLNASDKASSSSSFSVDNKYVTPAKLLDLLTNNILAFQNMSVTHNQNERVNSILNFDFDFTGYSAIPSLLALQFTTPDTTTTSASLTGDSMYEFRIYNDGRIDYRFDHIASFNADQAPNTSPTIKDYIKYFKGQNYSPKFYLYNGMRYFEINNISFISSKILRVQLKFYNDNVSVDKNLTLTLNNMNGRLFKI